MKYSVFMCFLTVVSITIADELTDCKCWKGYEPHKDPEGVKCYGVLLLHTRPCNEPERPICKCSGNVTGIVSDTTGLWCSEYSEGEEKRRWACENKEEWNKFYEENPSEKP